MEFGEKIQDALFREIREELDVKVKKIKLIGLVDNVYKESGRKHHEIDLVFETMVGKITEQKITEQNREDHIGFIFLDKNRFKKEKILPVALQKAVLKWQRDKKFFWASQIYNEQAFYLKRKINQ